MTSHIPRFDGFLNQDTMRDSIARIGQAAIHPSGFDYEPLCGLIMLTCEAHGIQVSGLHRPVSENALRELGNLRVISRRTGVDTFKLA